ncbi:MAG TPA: septal ring lytic transglycosylase RlpA family protein [Solirubrobacteraceae bacterium]|jgi:rare lipoprotein A (peptidoglycan hydrolase)|nr:septal ring lytic transglycosylase RlpA family protein [Solirubrobacteraceae bacterium]
MRTAFFKHAFVATVMAASLSLAVSTALALADGSPSGGSPSSESAASGSPSGGAAPAQSPSHRRAIATWYGPGLYGHTTACGQKLTPKLVGLASRTLPCGTLVQISYHGHQLTAPVLDRGPFAHNGAMWDLTSGAARALEITETVRIATQVVGSLPNGPTLGEPSLANTPSPATASGPLADTPATAQPAATGGAAS